MAVKPDDARHQDLTNPLSDHRRHGDEKVARVRIADERDGTDARESIGAPLGSLFDNRVQAPCERPEGVRIAGVAPDLSADRLELAGRGFARIEDEALHRVEIDVEPGWPRARSSFNTFVQTRLVRTPIDVHPSRREAIEIVRHAGDQVVFRAKNFGRRAPALAFHVRGAHATKVLARFER